MIWDMKRPLEEEEASVAVFLPACLALPITTTTTSFRGWFAPSSRSLLWIVHAPLYLAYNRYVFRSAASLVLSVDLSTSALPVWLFVCFPNVCAMLWGPEAAAASGSATLSFPPLDGRPCLAQCRFLGLFSNLDGPRPPFLQVDLWALCRGLVFHCAVEVVFGGPFVGALGELMGIGGLAAVGVETAAGRQRVMSRPPAGVELLAHTFWTFEEGFEVRAGR